MGNIERWTIYDRESGSEHVTLSWARRGHGLDPLKTHKGPVVEVVPVQQLRGAVEENKRLRGTIKVVAGLLDDDVQQADIDDALALLRAAGGQ